MINNIQRSSAWAAFATKAPSVNPERSAEDIEAQDEREGIVRSIDFAA